jgi:DNA polymerase III delta prime subunit
MSSSDQLSPEDGERRAPQGAASSAGETRRRARPLYRVFVSSTWLDLQPERRALMEALNRMEEMRFVGMEFFGNRPEDTHEASIDQVEICEVLVGIIGFRYGSGITEAEYRRARELGLPCFIYFKRAGSAGSELTDDDPAKAVRLDAFKQELLRVHTVKEFERPEELAANATADLHNWISARWISLEQPATPRTRPSGGGADSDRPNILRLVERVEQDWIRGVLEASLHHRAWLELGLEWREDAVRQPWDRIVVAPNRPISALGRKDSITGVFDAAQHTLLVLGEPGAGKTTTVLELARDLIARVRTSAAEPAPVVLALSTWRGQQTLGEWMTAELGLRYQVPKRIARTWLEEGRLVLILDGLDEVATEQRAAGVAAINAFAEEHHPPGLAVTCRVHEYQALPVKLRLRSAICLQPLTPEQVDQYFRAAGARLDHLRAALRSDEVLRELASSPLMLSVMTMAWRGTEETVAPGVEAGTPAQIRRQLFSAYVAAALNRHGKVASDYAPDRTIAWLAWLARRMKENGLTLFALEHLQPGWLPGAGSQLGYMLITRSLGTIALVLPMLAWPMDSVSRLFCLGLAVATGLGLGLLDFMLLRTNRAQGDRGSRRLWLMLLTLLVMAEGSSLWAWFGGFEAPYVKPTLGQGLLYLVVVAFALCAPVDVRALDIKPSDTMRWSWRQALQRFGAGVVALNLLVSVAFGGIVLALVAEQGWKTAVGELIRPFFLAGLVLGFVAGVLVGRRLWSLGKVFAICTACAGPALGGQLGALLQKWNQTAFTAMLLALALAAFVGVFGGFTAGMVNPERGKRSGVWFWLRVPLLAAAVVGALMMVPGVVVLLRNTHRWDAEALRHVGGPTLILALSAGLVAFFRFGGFNGLQHGILRWLLVRAGRLPPNAEKFFDHTARLALTQKVGFGYRFIHAMLLDHFAQTPDQNTPRT